MFSEFAALMGLVGLSLAALALHVGRRRDTTAGVSLAVLLVSVAWWGVAYAAELSVTDLSARLRWGDLKYLGVCALAPAWLLFVLQYTGRVRRVSRRLLALVALEPLLVLIVLAVPATHDLVRFYPPSERDESLPVVATGPVFWIHFGIANLVILVATCLFVTAMVRLAGIYRRMAFVMVAAALLPWAANVLHNFEVGWFARRDLTPFAFTVTGGVLVWGLFREGLVNLAPMARRIIVETMTDAVYVLDVFGRIADLNPAAARLLDRSRREALGVRLDEHVAVRYDDTPTGPTRSELTIDNGSGERTFDAQRQPLTDRAGRPAGQLFVLRDITDRIRTETSLRALLVERSRIAATLQASLVPGRLPAIPGAEVVTRYQPAGDGREVGGDFFDIFPLADGRWGVVLGDVSGKGSEAAAVTALTRYTLRTLADARHRPSRTLQQLNARLLAATAEECHCTLVYAVARPARGGVDLTLSLGGHHPPLVLRHDGTVGETGRTGTVVGLFEDAQFHDCTLHLGPGDAVCLFTNGLVEARNGNELFGTDRVAALLEQRAGETIDDLAAGLVGAAQEFHGADLVDDLALLILRARVQPAQA